MFEFSQLRTVSWLSSGAIADRIPTADGKASRDSQLHAGQVVRSSLEWTSGNLLGHKVLVQTEELVHVLLVKFEVEDVGILDDPLLGDRLWNLEIDKDAQCGELRPVLE